MSDLTPDDKALLDLAREAHEPTEGDRGRVRRALLVQLGVGTGLVGTTAATSKAATAVVVTKVFAALAIAGAIGGTGAAVYHAAKAAPAPPPAHAPAPVLALAPTLATPAPTLAPTPTPADLQQPPSMATAPESDDHHPPVLPKTAARANSLATTHIAPPPSQVTTPPLADSPSLTLQETALPSVDPSPANAAPAPLPPTTLEAETRLIRAGIAALHGGDAARALALFDEHARAFPAGALAEERAAERIIALGALHRCDQARAAAADFLLEHPHSPLSARVREPCGQASNP